MLLASYFLYIVWIVTSKLLVYSSHTFLLLLFSCSVMSDSLWHHGLQHTRLPCPSPSPGACSNSCPLSRWCLKPSHPLSSPSPTTFNLSQHQGVFKWVSSLTLIKRLFSSSLLSAIKVYHLHVRGYWYFFRHSWFQLVIHPAQDFTWYTLRRN